MKIYRLNPPSTVRVMTAAIALALTPLGVNAAGDSPAALKSEVEVLRKELSDLREQVKRQGASSVTKEDVRAITQEAVSTRDVPLATPYQWDKSTSFHFGGYAAAGYASQKKGDRSFDPAVFVPGFHFNYRDIAFVEAKFETAVEESGETETKLESANVNLFLNDYSVLTVGKFLSPLGQFQQNYHAPWINKLASRPVGFGEEASGAPLANVGAQIRGGFPIGAYKANYAVFVANAPGAVAEERTGPSDIEFITNDSGTSAPNNKKIWGGRVSFFPMPLMEIGLSGALGKTAAQLEDGDTGLSRKYRAGGVDFAWQLGKQWDFRGEYIRQAIGGASGDEIDGTPVDNAGQAWKAMYLQAAYKFMPKWEGIARYSKFDSTERSQWQKQWALGVNYWYASNVVGKVTYELNEGRPGRDTDKDRLLLQVTYGF